MDIKEIWSVFLESVLARPLYYLTLCALLVVLIAALIALRVRRRKKEEEKRRQNDGRHIPKYAAGDEMDRIPRRSYYQRNSGRPPLALVALVICGTLAVCSYVKYPTETKDFIRNTLAYQPNAPRIRFEPLAGNLQDVEWRTTVTFSSDYRQLFFTTVFVNRGDATRYNIASTYQLMDKNENVAQTKDGDTIPSLSPGQSVEKTTSIQLEIEASEISEYRQSVTMDSMSMDKD